MRASLVLFTSLSLTACGDKPGSDAADDTAGGVDLGLEVGEVMVVDPGCTGRGSWTSLGMRDDGEGWLSCDLDGAGGLLHTDDWGQTWGPWSPGDGSTTWDMRLEDITFMADGSILATGMVSEGSEALIEPYRIDEDGVTGLDAESSRAVADLIWVDVDDADRMLAWGSGVVSSDDGGTTWEDQLDAMVSPTSDYDDHALEPWPRGVMLLDDGWAVAWDGDDGVWFGGASGSEAWPAMELRDVRPANWEWSQVWYAEGQGQGVGIYVEYVVDSISYTGGLVSQDGGATFSSFDSYEHGDHATPYIYDLAVDATGQALVVTGNHSTPLVDAAPEIIVSLDGGETWTLAWTDPDSTAYGGQVTIVGDYWWVGIEQKVVIGRLR